MEFYTGANIKRPVRLCESTRQFAYDSLNFKYGQDTLKTDSVMLDEESLKGKSILDRYDTAITTIAEKAPVRICPNERISGAATLGAGIRHLVPAKIGDQYVCYSVSHLTVNFETVLKNGYDGIRERTLNMREECVEPKKLRFYQSVLTCLDAFEKYHQRYIDALEKLPEYSENLAVLRNVPKRPATTFREAVQSIWFTFSFLRLCGNWPGIGRVDVLLGGYLKKDLSEGRITLEEAREILAHFMIKGCEWVCGGNYGSGDAQHYQNIVLAGIDGTGAEVTNDVTYLILDVVEELGISDFPITMRLNRSTDPYLMRRIAEVIRYGGGIIAVYNEDLILRSMKQYGYSESEAVRFANDGCWEVQVPGATNFSYWPFDSLELLQKNALQEYRKRDFADWEAVYSAFADALRGQVHHIGESMMNDMFEPAEGYRDKWLSPQCATTLVSIFEDDCIGKGRAYHEGGTVYTVRSPHIGGLADTVNSLYAIKKMVFDDRYVSLDTLFDALQANWEGYEPLRQYALNHYRYYGNDNDEADEIAVRILNDFASFCKEIDGKSPVSFPAGVSTFGRQIAWAPNRIASPHGRKCGEILSGNASPTPGTDKGGATSVIRSFCKPDLAKMVTGAALDIQLMPMSTEGEEGLQALISLMKGFLVLGGSFMQIDVADASVLRDAQAHPEQYQTLSVRVSGWNARFATLDKQWQDMVIQRAEKG